MKLSYLITLVFFLAACRPVHVTKQYYDEYINPTASIDYEDTASADIPAEFLDDYYRIDSKIVRFVDQIDIMDSTFSESWVMSQKEINPWIKSVAVLDSDMLFVLGDDTLGYDPAIRARLLELKGGKQKIFIRNNDASFFVHVGEIEPKKFTRIVVNCDINELASDISDVRTQLAIGDHVFSNSQNSYSNALKEIGASSKYSGSTGVDGKELYWIRSMAAENFVYLFAK